MKIVEILDSENIKSNFESWFEECQKFRTWYHNLGIRAVSEIEMERACLKIEHRIKNQPKYGINRVV